ncbi:Transmembrane protein 144 [Strongyloides ratti]|uniref:Transmembrane protein 144 n=1 Tax=Strongyloides ratti TaxID=34506 RepID=A0A090LC92_STRRB|nr:Transmembrane protein 144 [Strongyloides ratti]CEF67421.1 Transmembrane protein 144 [Strongyloides ratti]
MTLGFGLGACAIASVAFGSMFVPLKKYDAGDGIFSQLIMAVAILISSFVINSFQNFPPFEPYALISGVLWVCGNSMAVPIINKLGLSVGILLWNSVNCCLGAFSSVFGWFGTESKPPSLFIPYFIGVLFVVIGGFIFSLIKKENVFEERESNDLMENGDQLCNETFLMNNDTRNNYQSIPTEKTNMSTTKIIEKSLIYDRILGVVMAVLSGSMYALVFVPITILQQSETQNPKKHILDYFFSFTFGIFITATVVFIIYGIVKKNKPYVNSSVALPALIAGVLWTIGQSSFFVANENLSQSISFPIITTLPGVISSLWSIFFFHEISSKKNIIKLIIACSITFIGVIIVSLSR